MESVSCTIWVLVALMVMASVDAVPDPPAVNPHTVSVTSLIRLNQGGSGEPCVDWDSHCTSLPPRVHCIRFTDPYEPNRPSDSIALTGHAADPSPPAA